MQTIIHEISSPFLKSFLDHLEQHIPQQNLLSVDGEHHGLQLNAKLSPDTVCPAKAGT